jgi:excisionase family DNA binding protein
MNTKNIAELSRSHEIKGNAWLTKREIASHCRVTARTIDNWMATHKLPFFRIGRTVRFCLVDVEAHFQSLAVA